MEKVTFDKVGQTAEDVAKRGTVLWQVMAQWVMSACAPMFKAAAEDKGEALKAEFKRHEAEYKQKHNVNLNAIGAYRSAKSVVNAAARHEVAVMEKGATVGKTDVERSIKAARGESDPLVVIQRAFTMADGKLDKLTGKTSIAAVFIMSKAFYDKVSKLAEEEVGSKRDLEKQIKAVKEAQVSSPAATANAAK